MTRAGSLAAVAGIGLFVAAGVLPGLRIPPEGRERIEISDVVAACRATGTVGWDLVLDAQRRVHERFTHYSCLHWWENPSSALRNRRGYCSQYNGALAEVLRRLGFAAWTVSARRVAVTGDPSWRLGHTWVRATVGGSTQDVCAHRADNRPGQVGFVPLTPVRRFGTLTFWATTVGMLPLVSIETLSGLLPGRSPAPWLYQPMDA